MKSLALVVLGRRGKTIASALGICLVCGFSCLAGDGLHPRGLFHRSKAPVSSGYGGTHGFGLSYHLGYGYGGSGLGVGPEGGNPDYGGPGYPHCEPALRRCGGIEPFLYYGGPGYPRFGHSPYFEVTGPLQVKPSIVEVGDGRDSNSASSFGPFTGAPSYSANKLFAPYSSGP